MKLAIPIKMNKENSAIAPLFGKAKWFAIVENDNISIIPNNQSGGIAVIELFHEMKIDASKRWVLALMPKLKSMEI